MVCKAYNPFFLWGFENYHCPMLNYHICCTLSDSLLVAHLHIPILIKILQHSHFYMVHCCPALFLQLFPVASEFYYSHWWLCRVVFLSWLRANLNIYIIICFHPGIQRLFHESVTHFSHFFLDALWLCCHCVGDVCHHYVSNWLLLMLRPAIAF